MNTEPAAANPAAPRKSRRLFVVLLLIAGIPFLCAGLVVTAIGDLLGASTKTTQAGRIVQAVLGEDGQQMAQISTGGLVWLGAKLGAEMAGAPEEATRILKSVKSADVEIYSLGSAAKRPVRKWTLGQIDRELAREKWESTASVDNRDVSVRVLLRNADLHLKDAEVCVLVLTPHRELILVNARADLELLGETLAESGHFRELKLSMR